MGHAHNQQSTINEGDNNMSRGALGIVKKFFPDVTKVEDSKKDAMIEVLPQDIKSSTVRNHNACALAVACKRKLKADGIIISVSKAYIIKGTKAVRFDLAESAAREIVAFDRDGRFEPGEYKLSKPPKYHALGRTERGPHLSNGHKRKGFRHMTGGIRTTLGSNELS